MKLNPGAALAAAAIVALAGCAAVERQEAADSEQLLQQAGFQALPANSPERSQQLKGMQPRQLFARTADGRTSYVFADPYNCDCLYVGGAKEYAQLQGLREARMEEHDRLAAEASDSEVVDLNLWGPWNPEGLQAK